MTGAWRDRLRTLVRTRSWRATQALHAARRADATIRMAGYPHPIRLRTGTMDADLLRRLAWWGRFPEYELPTGFRPRVILDIGANIGAVALSLLRQFPDAALYAFEPFPPNFELLEYNLSGYASATALPYGLGRETTTATYTLSPGEQNFGGGGFFGGASAPGARTFDLPLVKADEALAKATIDRVDLIKIDVEGAEYDILTALPTDVLGRVGVIVGELHRYRDRELLDYLSAWFEIATIDKAGHPNYFTATNKKQRQD